MVQAVKNLPTMQETQETQVPSLGQEDPPEKEMATHFSILSWKIPWTEERLVNHPQTIPQVWNASSFCNIFFQAIPGEVFPKISQQSAKKI